MYSLFNYCTHNPIFAISFIFSRIPLWVLLAMFSLGYLDPINTGFGAIFLLFARGYVEQEISVGVPTLSFFKTAVLKPLLVIIGIFLFIAVYPFLLYFLASEDIYMQTGFMILLIFAVYLWITAGREAFGVSVFGIKGLKRPTGKVSIRILITFLWIYVLTGQDGFYFTIPTLLTILFLEFYQFTVKYEGII